jgi:putative tricarboxylic transport membrane protein
VRGQAWTLGLLGAGGAYLALALALPLGNMARPGPGFFPVAVGVFLCLAAGFLVAARLRGAALASTRSVGAEARGRVGTAVAALVGFVLLLPWIGFPACALVFVAVLLRRLAGAGWAGAIVTATLSALVSYYVFGVVLGVPLPTGPF